MILLLWIFLDNVRSLQKDYSNMCGIYCSITNYSGEKDTNYGYKERRSREILQRRGPDRSSTHTIVVLDWIIFFEAHILWMQGKKPVTQPFVDEFGNILLWNGDIFSGIYKEASQRIGDTAALMKSLIEMDSSTANILETFSGVNGPWSMIYWNESRKTLWFGRDGLGRHSLLWCKAKSGTTITSVMNRNFEGETWEVPAVGIFSVDFGGSSDCDSFPALTLHPWSHLISPEMSLRDDTHNFEFLSSDHFGGLKFDISDETINSPFSLGIQANKSLDKLIDCPPAQIASMPCLEALNALMESWEDGKSQVDTFIELLKESVKARVQIQPGLCKNCLLGIDEVNGTTTCCPHPKTCVLFSGGIDSAVLALLCDLFVPENEAIDLLNVAFAQENKCLEEEEVPVCDKIGPTNNTPLSDQKVKSSKRNGSSTGQKSHTFSEVPDRVTGKIALDELKILCPRRIWNFVEINVSASELNKVRQEVISDLIHPLNTVLDDSLGCAMWFAARGTGTLERSTDIGDGDRVIEKESYTSPARVAILGNGADEQLGGYSRHRSSLEDGGWPSLEKEMLRQVRNLPTRNLGRDDRICSDHGRQPRFPFLDEAVVSYLSELSPWQKVAACVRPRKKKSVVVNEELIGNVNSPLTLRPGVGDKALLRLVALKLGFKNVCSFPKRAMQFGSRVAKLETTRKEKANDICQRLTSVVLND